MKNIVIAFSLLFSINASAETIPALDLTSLPVSNLDSNYVYQIAVERIVTPTKMTGNPFRDSKLEAKCGDIVLASQARRIAPADFGKPLSFSLNFELSTEFCDALAVDVSLQVNGITIESPTLFYSVTRIIETADSFVARTRSALATKQQDLVFYHGEMSKAAGNQKSLHCLIETNTGDTNLEPILLDLKSEYRKLFGAEYVDTNIDCSIDITLESEIATCSTEAPKRSFCAFYTLYGQTLAWFGEATTGVVLQRARLRAGDSTRQQNLNDITDALEKAKTTSLSQVGGGV